MRNCISVLLLFGSAVAASGAAAGDVALVGVIGSKAAVLVMDGSNPKTVKVGQRWKGITVLRVDGDRATLEIDGKQQTVTRGQYYSSGAGASSDRQSATLAADARGHFVAEGSVNGIGMRFLVDTGATLVALPASDAQRLGIDYRKGERGTTQTANGVATVYRVTLDRVKLGSIELSGVDAVVMEQGLPIALLGMSFLNRVEMKRNGRTMTLLRRF